MYASQNLSISAIRYLSEVVEKKPHNYKAIFVKAKEHVKLDEEEIASQLIEKGLTICNELGNQEYQYRFTILRKLIKSYCRKLEQAVLAGMNYFKTKDYGSMSKNTRKQSQSNFITKETLNKEVNISI